MKTKRLFSSVWRKLIIIGIIGFISLGSTAQQQRIIAHQQSKNYELASAQNQFQANSYLIHSLNEETTNNYASIVQQKKEITIKGQVTDKKTGEPIIGATVSVQNSTTGTITNIDGNYELIVSEGSILRFSFVGYNEKTETVKKSGILNVALTENTIQLNDVVVVGYGTQKKINLTGSVSMVKGDVLQSRPITSVGAGLQGELPGVTITNPTGQPGSSISIKIRGTSTINSSTSPLILIDGVAGGDINLLNPDDVENISVLKDAASSAIYGARAANGVILITTKAGTNTDKTTLSYNGYAGWQKPTRLPKLVNGREYMQLYNEAMEAAGFSKPFNEEAFQKYDSGNYPNEYSNTNWIDEVYKKCAFQTGHNVNIRGGNKKNTYYMSYGYIDQDGLIIGDTFKSRRHNARINVTSQVFDRLRVNGNMSFVDFTRSECGYSGTSGVFRLAQRLSPLLPVKWQEQDEEGNWRDTPWYSFGMVRNPVNVALNSGSEKRNSRTFNGMVNAELNIIKGLDLNGQYAANYYYRNNDEFNPAMYQYYSDGTPDSGNEKLRNYVTQSNLTYLTQSMLITLKYNNIIAKLHDVGALLGYSQEWEDRTNLSATRKNILLDNIYVIDAGTEDFTNGGNKESWSLRSYFGRINYAFDSKYLFEANMRIDGTSRFASGNRWGYFPSFSAGWNFNRETFMRWAEPALSSGKIRLSWGELGNQNIGSNFYPYLTPIERVIKSYPIGANNNVGFMQIKLGNKNIKWETIRMMNAGIDLSFLNNRLSGSFDWFKKKNINALVQPVYPTLVGITGSSNLPFENMGEIENKGWEVSLQWRDNIGDLTYGLSFNMSDTRNKIKDLGKSNPSLGDNLRRVGDAIDAYFGLRNDGLAQISDFEEQDESGRYINPKFAVPVAAAGVIQPGDIKYRDISGPDGVPDNVIDDYDKVVFGDPSPHYLYAFKGNLEWKGIDFSFYFQGVGKADGYLSSEARHCFINDYSIPKVEHLDRWTPTHTNAKYPRLFQAQTHNLLFCDYWLEDASYLRLKNIQLGYTFPSEWVKPMKISKLRIYASADNLFTISDYFGAYDPELRESEGDAYPQVKTIIFGLSITL